MFSASLVKNATETCSFSDSQLSHHSIESEFLLKEETFGRSLQFFSQSLAHIRSYGVNFRIRSVESLVLCEIPRVLQFVGAVHRFAQCRMIRLGERSAADRER